MLVANLPIRIKLFSRIINCTFPFVVPAGPIECPNHDVELRYLTHASIQSFAINDAACDWGSFLTDMRIVLSDVDDPGLHLQHDGVRSVGHAKRRARESLRYHVPFRDSLSIELCLKAQTVAEALAPSEVQLHIE